MATPSGALPSPASKKSAVLNNVSTPSQHNLSSPAPRSVPSPAATRKDLSGKTPAAQSTGSKTTVGGTPMMLNLSQQGSMASPVPGIGMTPTGLGVDLGTPGLAATPALAAGMVPTMSELGLTASGGLKRNEDEERRAKMRKILKMMGRPKGRIGEEGIARVSRRVGFANDIDAEKLSNEERERRIGNRTISIAGNTMVIDVDLKNNIPQGVQVAFQNEMSNKDGRADRAGSILLQDLSTDVACPVNAMLDKFSANLERLARLDRVSTKVNCFDALSGIYSSLKKLYDQELKLASSLKEPEKTVMESKSGYPALHEDGALGLSLTYSKDHKIWFEAERCPSGIFPPIRTSSAWLADDAANDSWQEPPQTYLDHEDGGQTLPDVRFMARFDPPIVMPWQVAANIFQGVGTTMPAAFQLPTYLSLLLGHAVTNEVLVTKSSILRPASGGFIDVEHVYRIGVAKHDVGFKLEELPFSHPRQIVDLLPVLRQWLTLNNIILNQLKAGQAVGETERPVKLDKVLDNGKKINGDLIVDSTVVTSPTPIVCLSFLLENEELCTAGVEILLNGGKKAIDLELANANKALAIADLGTWIEWVRSKKTV